MSNVLERICDDKRAHIAERKRRHRERDLRAAATEAPPPRGFAAVLGEAVHKGGVGLVTEIKKASPSKGVIRDDFDPAVLARAYRKGGATCLSVLTDAPYFQGDDAHLQQARRAVDLPVLRKDFILDPYQVTESRALGADCILLIMAALDDSEAAELTHAAGEWGMDTLIEVHDRAELDRALACDSKLIGINNRNLKTLEVDLATTEHLARHLPADRTLVCESGIESASDIDRMRKAGAHCFLIGESLMRQPDVAAATRALTAAATA